MSNLSRSSSSSTSSFVEIPTKDLMVKKEKKEPVAHQETIEERKLREDLDWANHSIDKMADEIQLMRMERLDLKDDAITQEHCVLNELEGSWQIIASSEVEHFLAHERALNTFENFPEGSKELELYVQQLNFDEVLFQTALQNIEPVWKGVRLYESVGDRQFNKKVLALSEPEGCEMTWIAGDVLKTVRIGGRDPDVEERFVIDGKLHITFRKYGIGCTRIYKRVGAADKNLADLQNEIMMLNLEKKEMEQQIKELREQLKTSD